MGQDRSPGHHAALSTLLHFPDPGPPRPVVREASGVGSPSCASGSHARVPGHTIIPECIPVSALIHTC
jgi:hypothetical protein